MSIYAYEWLAFQGKRAEDVLAAARLRDSGVTSWAADGLDQIWATPISNDWHVVVFTNVGNDRLSEDSIAQLSQGCTLVGCLYAKGEGLTFGLSFLYRDGEKVWRVSQEGSAPLKVEGTPPQGLSAGPLELAFQVCGYRHDSGQLRYTELVPVD